MTTGPDPVQAIIDTTLQRVASMVHSDTLERSDSKDRIRRIIERRLAHHGIHVVASDLTISFTH